MAKKPRIRVLAMAIVRRGDGVFVNESRDPVTGEVFYRPLGGMIEFGERAVDAVAREFMEEIGAGLVNIRYLRTFESVFTHGGRAGHEIILMHEGDFADSSFYECGEIVSELNKNDPIRASWTSLEFFEQGKAPLYPEGLLELLVGAEDW
jgi:NADH pyrophosphatase NudC (nudix superfamily)